MVSDYSQMHKPVLFDEVLNFLPPKDGCRYLDGTLGLGGHSEGLLQRAEELGAKGVHLAGMDRDLDALALASERLKRFGANVHLKHSVYSEFPDFLDELGWEKVDMALVDIGVSSIQLDRAERGFSFIGDGPLDMRMDQSQGQSAAVFVNKAPIARIREVIAEYGEDPMAGRIARAIESARSREEISTTAQLAAIVESAYPHKWRVKSRNHPATRTFQALRMVVNDELGELSTFLEAIVSRLNKGGRVAVITFHSLEDRMVKHFFRGLENPCTCSHRIPYCVCGKKPEIKVLTKKPVIADEGEITANPRARSAKLRVAEKV